MILSLSVLRMFPPNNTDKIHIRFDVKMNPNMDNVDPELGRGEGGGGSYMVHADRRSHFMCHE